MSSHKDSYCQENPKRVTCNPKAKTTMSQNQAHTKNWAVKEDNPTLNENIQIKIQGHATMKQEP